MASSPASDLSALNSDDFDDEMPRSRSGRADSDEGFDDNDSGTHLRPPKRRRVTRPTRSPPRYDSPMENGAEGATAESTDVSSDTTGSAPGSPRFFKDIGMSDEATVGSEQVRVCQWDGCNAGDLGNQDLLVQHMNDIHVAPAKKARFTCEWGDCKAKGKPQLSAYALRAHLRSHTKEKPFYCALPECDRSFTRSDALAKHMRTVHESESVRTIEHYAKRQHSSAGLGNSETYAELASAGVEGSAALIQAAQSSASKPPQRLKLVFSSNNKPSSPSGPQPAQNGNINGAEASDLDGTVSPSSPLSPSTRDTLFGPLPSHLHFTEAEAALPRRELFRLLRRQLHWAEQEATTLQSSIDKLERERRKEWLAKELALENVLEGEFARAEKTGVFNDEGIDSMFGEGVSFELGDKEAVSTQERTRVIVAMERDAEAASQLPLQGTAKPWYRSEEHISARKAQKAAAENDDDDDDDDDEDEEGDDATEDEMAETVAVIDDAGDETEEDETV